MISLSVGPSALIIIYFLKVLKVRLFGVLFFILLLTLRKKSDLLNNHVQVCLGSPCEDVETVQGFHSRKRPSSL